MGRSLDGPTDNEFRRRKRIYGPDFERIYGPDFARALLEIFSIVNHHEDILIIKKLDETLLDF